jgi:DNA topoisomerase-1
MAQNLVIVESPAKAKTIEKFLGAGYQVASSFGHIADLPSRTLGIDVEGDFTPQYKVSADKKAVVAKLKELADKAQTVWLASDEDREGEAISWHLAETLQLDPSKTKRIVFNSITQSAILKAIEQPRSIDYHLVNAQQARRVLDRIVGYELSPVLWKKIKPGLSAGRVQSVAVRLIVERERAIERFVTEASFKVQAWFKTDAGPGFEVKLGKSFPDEAAAHAFLSLNQQADFSVETLDKKPAKKSPSAPFTTSTLQQEASRKLGFSVSRTMQVAQRLYEAGLITYMRTDSVNLSAEAIQGAQKAIEQQFGTSYFHKRTFNTKSKGAQEAHEAIRPTDMGQSQVSAERDQQRLYELIWKRTLASQMADAQLERTTAKIIASTHQEVFTAQGEMILFDGFLKVYLEGVDDQDPEEQEGMLPTLVVGAPLTLTKMHATERYSRPPYRYSEATLVKQLEELGIGRPSTYAPTISTIQNRGYVEKGSVDGAERPYRQLVLNSKGLTAATLTEKTGSDKGKLVPTDIGMIVNDFLMNHFEQIMDYHFTAKVEAEFDEIALGSVDWKSVMRQFYDNFHPNVANVEATADRASGERILGTDPVSGRPVLVRLGRFGPMVQIGHADDEEKPVFASLLPDQSLGTITFEEAMKLFELPRTLGQYQGDTLLANVGRFGPYIKYGEQFVSLDPGQSAMEITLDEAIALVERKKSADAPIAQYDSYPVTKGVGRFGPFIKWNGLFINVPKKYDFEALSSGDIEELIEDKKKKESEKVVQNWAQEGIRIEKARWGRHTLMQGKLKIELDKSVDVSAMTLAEAQNLIEKKAPKKAAKKPAAKKSTSKTKK